MEFASWHINGGRWLKSDVQDVFLVCAYLTSAICAKTLASDAVDER